MKKEFKKDNVTYSVRQACQNGVQYQASYADGQTSWVFIKGKNHTRKQVIEAVERINEAKED